MSTYSVSRSVLQCGREGISHLLISNRLEVEEVPKRLACNVTNRIEILGNTELS